MLLASNSTMLPIAPQSHYEGNLYLNRKHHVFRCRLFPTGGMNAGTSYEKLLLDPACLTFGVPRNFLFLHALSPEYEKNREYYFRQVEIANHRDEDGNVTKVPSTFDQIENKAIEQGHRYGQLGNKPAHTTCFLPSHSAEASGSRKLYRR